MSGNRLLALTLLGLVACTGSSGGGVIGNGGSSGAPSAGGSAQSSGGAVNGSGGSVMGSGGASGGGATAMCPVGARVLDDLERQDYWGYWFAFNDATVGGSQLPTGTFAPETADGGGYAVHTSGNGFTNWGAGVGFNLTGVRGCYDLGLSGGIRFRAKGPAQLSVGAVLPGVIPIAEGGTCLDTPLCYDTHRTSVAIGAGWAEYQVDWSDLHQDGWGEPVALHPYAVLTLQFTVGPAEMPFDYWIDDVALLEGTTNPGAGGSGGATGSGGASSGGSGGTGPIGGNFAEVVSSAQFNQMFPERNSFYTYDGLVAAIAKYPGFAGEGDLATRKREAAAFFGNLARETGYLQYTEEISPPHGYCQQSQEHPCAAGKSYHGRGPIQLSWNYNYGAAGAALGRNLLANPDLVSTDPTVAWETALWFWMTSAPQGTTCHDVMVDNLGFGGTIEIINGNQECNGAWPEAVQQRVNAYLDFTGLLGVDPGGNQSC